jgi:hypothetical protein
VLGSFAAATECEHQGNIPVTGIDVEKKLEFFERLANYH